MSHNLYKYLPLNWTFFCPFFLKVPCSNIKCYLQWHNCLPFWIFFWENSINKGNWKKTQASHYHNLKDEPLEKMSNNLVLLHISDVSGGLIFPWLHLLAAGVEQRVASPRDCTSVLLQICCWLLRKDVPPCAAPFLFLLVSFLQSLWPLFHPPPPAAW